MKTELEQLLESLSDDYESKGIESEDEVEINSRQDIIKKIVSLESELKEEYLDQEEISLIKRKLDYWYRVANEWRE